MENNKPPSTPPNQSSTRRRAPTLVKRHSEGVTITTLGSASMNRSQTSFEDVVLENPFEPESTSSPTKSAAEAVKKASLRRRRRGRVELPPVLNIANPWRGRLRGKAATLPPGDVRSLEKDLQGLGFGAGENGRALNSPLLVKSQTFPMDRPKPVRIPLQPLVFEGGKWVGRGSSEVPNKENAPPASNRPENKTYNKPHRAPLGQLEVNRTLVKSHSATDGNRFWQNSYSTGEENFWKKNEPEVENSFWQRSGPENNTSFWKRNELENDENIPPQSQTELFCDSDDEMVFTDTYSDEHSYYPSTYGGLPLPVLTEQPTLVGDKVNPAFGAAPASQYLHTPNTHYLHTPQNYVGHLASPTSTVSSMTTGSCDSSFSQIQSSPMTPYTPQLPYAPLIQFPSPPTFAPLNTAPTLSSFGYQQPTYTPSPYVQPSHYPAQQPSFYASSIESPTAFLAPPMERKSSHKRRASKLASDDMVVFQEDESEREGSAGSESDDEKRAGDQNAAADGVVGGPRRSKRIRNTTMV